MIALLLLAATTTSSVGPGYYRWPTIHDDDVVFTAEGDLFHVDARGGIATRLTSHPGTEGFAAISPDGKWVAFSGQYEGPMEAYVLPRTGGQPRRLTYDGESTVVVGFTPEGKVLIRTKKLSTLPKAQLVAINPESLVRTRLPLYQAAEGTFLGDTLVFTRFEEQSSKTKRYQGGWIQQLWKLPKDAPEAIPLTTDYAGTSRTPMAVKVAGSTRVYFVSDRDGTQNLWSMDLDGKQLRQHTRHFGFDVRSASSDGKRIVYQLGADLHLFDPGTEKDTTIAIQLASDFDHRRERWVKDPSEFLSTAHLSPSGDRVALTLRGQAFVVPTKKGRVVSVTRSSSARHRHAQFFPDGKSILTLSDASGELDLWQFSADGVEPAKKLSNNHRAYFLAPVMSPDGNWIAFAERDLKLWAHNVKTGKKTLIQTGDVGSFGDLTWSGDSRFLAFTSPAKNGYAQIWLWSPELQKSLLLTRDRVESYQPAFTADGKWLAFLSDRALDTKVPSPWGSRQPEPYFDKPTKLYLYPLEPALRSPYAPFDELHPAPEEKKEDDRGKKAESKKATPDLQLIALQADRIVEAPLEAGNYEQLAAGADRFYLLAGDAPFDKGKKNLVSFPISNDDPKISTVLADVTGFELSLDRKKILARREKRVFVFPSGEKAPDKIDDFAIDFSRISLNFDPAEEWRQMFVEAWRLERDWFYDPNLHGVDWKEVLDRHLPLVSRVTERGELSDLVSQMVGELAALHTYVMGGEIRKGPDNIEPASLGADIISDEQAKGWRVVRIYTSDPDFPARRGPLSRPEVDVREGDVILAIDGVSYAPNVPVGFHLRNKVGKQVRLSVRRGDTKATFDTIVEPFATKAEEELRYDEWEYSRRLEVETRSNGRLGYVHLRSMSARDFNTWAREFLPVFDREGVVIDVRANRGGNIDSWLLSRLSRKSWFYWKPRVGRPYWNMQSAFRGHVVVLTDERTASDGEAFAEGIRRLGIGTVVGTRTWGGEIWLTMENVLVDGGIASAAEFGVYGPERQWLIEGHGVDPDIVVDSLPKATFEGKDEPLAKAIDLLLEKLNAQPVIVPDAPRYPNKSLQRPQ